MEMPSSIGWLVNGRLAIGYRSCVWAPSAVPILQLPDCGEQGCGQFFIIPRIRLRIGLSSVQLACTPHDLIRPDTSRLPINGFDLAGALSKDNSSLRYF